MNGMLNGTYAVPDWDGIREIRNAMPTLDAAVVTAPMGGRKRAIADLRDVEAAALRAARSTNTRYDEGRTA